MNKRLDSILRLLVLFAIIAGLAVGISLVLVIDQSQQAQESAVRAQAQAATSRSIAIAVREARNESIVRNCEEQNTRHTKSLAFLDKLGTEQIAQATPKKRATIRKEVKKALVEYELLFNALAPKENCKALLKRQSP